MKLQRKECIEDSDELNNFSSGSFSLKEIGVRLEELGFRRSTLKYDGNYNYRFDLYKNKNNAYTLVATNISIIYRRYSYITGITANIEVWNFKENNGKIDIIVLKTIISLLHKGLTGKELVV